MLPTIQQLLFRLVQKGDTGTAFAFQAQAAEIRNLPVTYNCPTQEA